MNIYLTKSELTSDTQPLRQAPAKGGLKRMLTRVFQRWEERRSIAALQQLDDWMLYDIGLTRHDIPESVAAWRKQRKALSRWEDEGGSLGQRPLSDAMPVRS